jgi:electron transfer flavoprotein beta subunit
MRVIVPVKQVPNTTDVRIDPKTGTLIREGVDSIVNPEDLNAVEAALSIRDAFGGEVSVLSMGPPQAEEAHLLTDRALAGADTLATAYSLSRAIRSMGEFDLIICGRQAIDGDTAQVGPQLAEFLKLPQITYVRRIDIEDGSVVAERLLEDGIEVVKAGLPALLTVTKEVNRPRYPTMGGIRQAHREKEIHCWTATDFDAEPWRIGLDGSPTWVKKTFSPPPKAPGQTLQGTPKEVGKELVRILVEKNLI